MTAFDEAELRHWLVDYSVIGCGPNDDDFEVSLKDFSIGSPEVADALSGTRRLGSFLVDVDAFDAKFFEISPIMEIWSKGRVGV
jgi:hypothetical protein